MPLGTLIFSEGSFAGTLTAGTASGYKWQAGFLQSAPAPAERVWNTIDLQIAGTSKLDLSANIARIENLLMAARDYDKRNSGYYPYLQWQPEGYTSAFRSKVYDGYLQYDASSLDIGQWNFNLVNCKLSLLRDNFWFGTAPTYLTLTNGSQTGTAVKTLGGLPRPATGGTYSCISTFTLNALGTVTACDIQPLELEYRPDVSVCNMHFGILDDTTSAGDNPALITFEGYGSVSPCTYTAGTNANYSSGTAYTIGWTGTNEQQISFWSLALVSTGGYTAWGLQVRNRWFMPVIGLAYDALNTYTDLKMRCAFTYGSVIYDGDWCTVGTEYSLLPLQPILYPNVPYEIEYIGSSYLRLYAKRATAGTHTIKIDSVYLVPLDSYRNYDIALYNKWLRDFTLPVPSLYQYEVSASEMNTIGKGDKLHVSRSMRYGSKKMIITLAEACGSHTTFTGGTLALSYYPTFRDL